MARRHGDKDSPSHMSGAQGSRSLGSRQEVEKGECWHSAGVLDTVLLLRHPDQGNLQEKQLIVADGFKG